MATEAELKAQVSVLANELNVPGVGVGVVFGDEDHQAFHGVTSVEDPLEVNERTLFQNGSTGKTYTSTAILRLVERGEMDLDATIRTYVPDLKLQDEDVARDVTLLQLLNHTAGWDGDLFENTGEGDDALDRYVARMATIAQVTPLGATVSYNNASLSLAGKALENVTGKMYEDVIRELVFEPLGMDRSFYFAKELMTYRFSQGHKQDQDGRIEVSRPWELGRYGNPMGGAVTTVADQLTWARFHMGDGTAKDGTRVLSEQMLKRMQQPTVECPGNALGDAVGISWLIRDVEGLKVVAHGGDTSGQHSIFEMVPEERFAITALTNCGPNGGEFNERIMRWAFEAYLGVTIEDPEPLHLDADALAEYAGRYETIAVVADLTVGDGVLIVETEVRPEVLEQLGEEPEDDPPIPLGILAGNDDRYIVPDGPAKGMKGYFTRDEAGRINGIHIGGRYAERKS
jgi:CubicO group peptidase (beta-lactamase class C family)